MGYERDGRDDGRSAYEDRQPRQDYDRSYGNRSYGARPDQGRDDGRSGYARDRQEPPQAERNRFASAPRDDDRGQARGRDRDDYGRQPQSYDYEDRGFLDRAGDEVRSWFGDEDAERRRRLDDRYAERDERSRGTGGSDYRGSTPGGYRATGDYGAGRGAGAERQEWGHDPSYRSWRDRQLEQFDRDYEDYRREHQSKFDTEFHGWRTNRQTQRDALGRVRKHQEVVGADGKHVGIVDKVRGDTIVLTKQDQDAGGRHHAIPSAWITSVDDKVTIGKSADEAHAHWRDAEQTSAFWGDEASRGQANAGRTTSSAAAAATAADQTRTPGQPT